MHPTNANTAHVLSVVSRYQKYKGASSEIVFQTLELESSKLRHCRRCCQRQFITVSVHLCVQHNGRDAVRRADSSATAETCVFVRLEYSVSVTSWMRRGLRPTALGR